MISSNLSVNQVGINSFYNPSPSHESFSDTWLMTNGANVGVVQLIGQAIRKRKLTKPHDKAIAIGVCNYGCVKNLSDFQRPEHMESTNHSSSVDEQYLMNNTIHPSRRAEQNLEMNHTHFVLLDDGTRRYYDIGGYRTRLVKRIANGRAKQVLSGIDHLFEYSFNHSSSLLQCRPSHFSSKVVKILSDRFTMTSARISP